MAHPHQEVGISRGKPVLVVLEAGVRVAWRQVRIHGQHQRARVTDGVNHLLREPVHGVAAQILVQLRAGVVQHHRRMGGTSEKYSGALIIISCSLYLYLVLFSSIALPCRMNWRVSESG